MPARWMSGAVPARAVRVYGLRPTLVWHHDQPFFELGSPVLKARALISKRIVDVVVSSILLLALSPLLIAIAIAIRLDSPGSPFFFQERAGLGGRRFRMFKFRTMHEGLRRGEAGSCTPQSHR